MRYIKPVCVALTALGLCSPALANNLVYVPNYHSGIKVSINESYLRENSLNNVIDNTYDFSTNAKIGYFFEGTGNDITLNYTYLRNDDSNSFLDITNSIFKKATYDCNLDTIDLEGGQRLCGGPLEIRLFAGARYTKLNHQLGLKTDDKKSPNVQSFDNTFKGLGPLMGTDIRYNLGNGFGIDTHLSTALIVGKLNSQYASNDYYRQISKNDRHVMPEVDAKIGLDCTYVLCNKSCIALEAGYQTKNYFNSMDNSPLSTKEDANFNGAYVDIKYCS